MSNPNRRTFVLTVVAGGGTLAASALTAQAATAPLLAESDPQAVALGYKADSTQVAAAKYPQHTPAQKCSGCNFFQGKASDATGPCQLFAGKQVSAKGWCTAYAKKA
jgi:hypothetical protein